MRRRILQSTFVVVALTALVLGGPLVFTTWRLVEDVTRSDLSARLGQIVSTLDEQLSTTDTVDLDVVAIAVPPGALLTVTTRRTGARAYGISPGGGAVVESLPLGLSGSATLAVPGGAMRSRQLQATVVVVLLVVLSVGTGAVVATITARRLAGPLQRLADRAARLGAGDFRLAPARHGIPELDRVSDVLDSSAGALAELVQRERELVGDVSHQLRSRLTALQLRLDELASHPDHAVAAEAAAALEQAERLAGVLDELLEAARAARAAGAGPVDLADELRAVADEWRGSLRSAGRTLRLQVPRGLLARATPARLREAVGVLVENALRHGAGPVTVSARRGEGATTVVEVSDAGAGVPEDLVPHVFDRGVSGGSSTGLGLALARALVEADGGRLELYKARPATFALFLPVPRPDDVVPTTRRSPSVPR